MKFFLKLSCVIILGAVISLFGYSLIHRNSSTDTKLFIISGEAYLKVLFLYVSMLLGIVLKAFHAQIEEYDKPSVTLKKLVKLVLKSKSLLTSVIVSPIIFFTVYNVVSTVPDNVISFCLAFQNGFFWKSILEERGKKQ